MARTRLERFSWNLLDSECKRSKELKASQPFIQTYRQIYKLRTLVLNL